MRTKTEGRHRKWRLIICMVAAMATARFNLMSGASAGWVAMLPLAIPLAGLAGVVLAARRPAAGESLVIADLSGAGLLPARPS